jgi:UDP-2-acetamido-2,6-beta-L-arabino-hexul-4-ose reductase
MRVLVTGANGFIGKNLLVRLEEIGGIEIITFTRENNVDQLPVMLKDVKWVFHLAGVNRPKSEDEFVTGNIELTTRLCDEIKRSGSTASIVYSSSIRAEDGTPYGRSKFGAENELRSLELENGNTLVIYRLPNVFGKWAQPNYNSVVATFCYNICRDLPVKVHDEFSIIRLTYIDDVIDSFIALLTNANRKIGGEVAVPEHQLSVGQLLNYLKGFHVNRESLKVGPVGVGFLRALYSTYVSYLPTKSFSYPVQTHGDDRGIFVEILKTESSGQFSFFTAHPGISRGGHYHHSKTEKFLVIKGKALFRFRHVLTNEYYEILASEDKLEIVETVPGWTHDLTNDGNDDLVCVIWANEIFNKDKPDTIVCPVSG